MQTIFGVVPHLNFAIYGLVVCGVAYLVPDWRHMQLVFNVPLVLLLSVYWVIPESPRYLRNIFFGLKTVIVVFLRS